LNHVLEVIGTSWAEKTKEAYGAGLQTYHIYCNTHKLFTLDGQHAPMSANTLIAFLSSCAGCYCSH
ncbi:hypothetical protein BKA82DRAFT_170196, partial [Pisolithus tinctorius]